MKLNLYVLTLLALLGGATTLQAKVVTPDEAQQIADRFIGTQRLAPRALGSASATAKLVYNGAPSTKSIDTDAPYYVFNYGDDAYVLVSGDDRMTPVLGYSDNGAFDAARIPSNVQAWLDSYAREYAALQAPDVKIIRTASAASTETFPATVAPLMSEIKWNQDAPYNNLCPLSGTASTYTGCVATAMAQVLKYHNYPTTGTGSYSYTTRTKKLSASFDFANTTFDWANMLPTYTTGNYSDEQATAVATLMYACGVSVSMDYSTDASGAYSEYIPDALINYFGYDSNVQYLLRDNYNSAEWMALIKGELSSGRPVLYDGASGEGGHEFVFDGYDSRDYVHVNWGWGGSYDGYFKVTALNPESVGIGGGGGAVDGYNFYQGMTLGIQAPNTGTSVWRNGFQVSEIVPTKKSFSKSSTFGVTISGMYNYGATFAGGYYGIIVEKDGVKTALTTKSYSKRLPLNGSRSLSCTNLSVSSLDDGEYLLYPAIKTSDSGAEWQRVRCAQGADGIYRLTVKDTQVTLTSYWADPDLTLDFTVSHNLYQGVEAAFDFNITNNSTTDEIYAPFGVVIYDSNSNYEVLELMQLALQPGESLTSLHLASALSDTIATGACTIYPVIGWGDSWGFLDTKGTASTIGSATVVSASSNLVTPITVTLKQNVISEGESLTVGGSISQRSTSTVFSNTGYWYIYDTSYKYADGGYAMSIFIDKGSKYTIDYTFTPNLSAGKYYLYLYSGGWLNNGSPATLTVTAPTGIADVAQDASSEPLVVYLAHADLLRINAPEGARSAEVYDLSGRLVATYALTDEASQSVSASRLARGTYIVRVAGAGKVETAKFVKP